VKVALVTYALQVGGIDTFLRFLGKYLAEKGHEPVFLETHSKGAWSDTVQAEGFRVVQILHRPWHSKVNQALRIGRFLQDFDAVVLNDAPAAQSVLGLLNGHTVAIPVLHSLLTSMHRNAAANAQNTDALAVVNPRLKANLVNGFGIHEEKVRVIPNGVMVPTAYPKSGDGGDGRPLRLAVVGHMVHMPKGIFHIPGILNSVVSSGTKVELDLVGDGPDLAALKEKLSDLEDKIALRFWGTQPNEQALSILDQADVLFMPSLFEGLPLALLEALSLGVVPVCSRVRGCTDFVVESGRNGLLVEPGDEEDFASAIVRLAGDREMVRSMSRAGWETARQRFSYRQMGSAYLELMESCRERRRTGRAHKRSGTLDRALLGDLPGIPHVAIRPVRKGLRILGLFPKPVSEPLLFK
jgi:glycosyltransferase involved in cell wall biosynthesis